MFTSALIRNRLLAESISGRALSFLGEALGILLKEGVFEILLNFEINPQSECGLATAQTEVEKLKTHHSAG